MQVAHQHAELYGRGPNGDVPFQAVGDRLVQYVPHGSPLVQPAMTAKKDPAYAQEIPFQHHETGSFLHALVIEFV